MSGPDPRVALVILTHDRRTEVCRTVERALALPEAPLVVVVDNGSRDGTAEALARRAPAALVVRSARNHGAAGRNLGARIANRRYVAFSDDDTWWQPGALRVAADHLDADPRLAVVTGRVLVGRARREDPTCAAMRRSPLARDGDERGVPVLGFLAGACMMRRRAFLAAGGYEPRLFLGGEEALLAFDLAAAGWRIGYFDDVEVRHLPSKARDARARVRLLARNELLVAWLRRPLAHAARESATRLAALSRAEALSLAASLLRAAPWVLRERRVLPPALEERVRKLEGSVRAAEVNRRTRRA